jgi:hypothetical protein
MVPVADAKSQQPNPPTDPAPMQMLQEDFVISGGQRQGVPQRFGQPETAMFNGLQAIFGGTFVQNVGNNDRRT